MTLIARMFFLILNQNMPPYNFRLLALHCLIPFPFDSSSVFENK